jgi:hypothetical protein
VVTQTKSSMKSGAEKMVVSENVSNFKLENGWLLEVKFLNSSKGAMALPLRGLTRDTRRETSKRR